MTPGARHTPQVIAHRGSSKALPEHTLKAYLRAIAEGANALECDVRLTVDSHLVCTHDRHINRTSNGRGLVSTLELATLEGLDFGSWKLAHDGEVEMPDVDHERDMLLTLRRLIDVVLKCGREVGLAIETKHPTRYAGQVERQLAQVLAEFDLQGSHRPGKPLVRVMSFSQLALTRMRQLCPQVPLVYLMKKSVPIRFRDGSLPKGVRIAGLDKEIISRWPETVQRQHNRGNEVYVFTVDDEADIDLCLELGVEAIISNRPGFVRQRLALGANMPEPPEKRTVSEEGQIAERSLRLPWTISSAVDARRALVSELHASRVDATVVDESEIVISELVSNAVRHAEPLADGTIEVSWSIRADVVEIEVTDGGGVTTPQPAPRSMWSSNGRGLRIVGSLAHEWGVEENRTGSTVWASMGGPSPHHRL